jgi:hypothetical protein
MSFSFCGVLLSPFCGVRFFLGDSNEEVGVPVKVVKIIIIFYGEIKILSWLSSARSSDAIGIGLSFSLEAR